MKWFHSIPPWNNSNLDSISEPPITLGYNREEEDIKIWHHQKRMNEEEN